MAKFYIIFALGAVTQMAEQQFAQKIHMAFHQAGMFPDIRLVFFYLLDLFPDLEKRSAMG